MALTAFDHEMIHHAAQRGVVIVDQDGRKALAVLIAWRKQRHGCHTNQARVQYESGRYRSVHITQVALPEGVVIEH